MKKLCPLLLAVALLLALCACGGTPDVPNSESPSPTATVTPTPDPTPTPSESEPVETPTAPFTAPEGTVLCGVDVSGMLRDEALAAITAAAPGYSLALNVSGKAVTISGDSAALALDENLFDACWQALESGSEYSDGLFTVAASDYVESTIAGALEYSPKNPYVAYSSSQGKFVVVPGTNGMDYEVGTVAEQAVAAMSRLAADCTVSVTGTEVAPSLSVDDSRLTTAVEAAEDGLAVTGETNVVPGEGVGDGVGIDQIGVQRNTVAERLDVCDRLLQLIFTSETLVYREELWETAVVTALIPTDKL